MTGSNPPSDPGARNWIDAHGRSWAIELGADAIRLRGTDQVLEIPPDRWLRDISVAAHGQGYIVRFDTFEVEVGFSVRASAAAALVSHIGEGLAAAVPEARPVGGASAVRADRETSSAGSGEATPSVRAGRVEALWPRVSPLAVWALICASVAFVPVLGLLPAAGAGVLLILHRIKTRRSVAYRHSRLMCAAAMVFLVSGLVVSVPAGYCIWKNQTRSAPDLRRTLHSAGADGRPADRSGESPASPAFAGAGSDADPGDEDAAGPNWGLVVAGLLVVMLSLTVHEAAHAITAWWLGDDFARRSGRVTLNPLAHIDPVGTVLLPLLLYLTKAGAVFGWARPVPVRTECLRHPRRDHILVSIAGPGSNLLLACASMILLMGMGSGVSLMYPDATVDGFPRVFEATRASGFPGAAVFGAAATILSLSVVINLILAAFNMIPIPPLDGSWVLENLFPRTLGRFYARIRPFGFLLFILLLFSGALEVLLVPVAVMIALAISLVSSSALFA